MILPYAPSCATQSSQSFLDLNNTQDRRGVQLIRRPSWTPSRACAAPTMIVSRHLRRIDKPGIRCRKLSLMSMPPARAGERVGAVGPSWSFYRNASSPRVRERTYLERYTLKQAGSSRACGERMSPEWASCSSSGSGAVRLSGRARRSTRCSAMAVSPLSSFCQKDPGWRQCAIARHSWGQVTPHPHGRQVATT
jgi:hypothetical protein